MPQRVKNGTLTAATVATVNLDDRYPYVEVVNVTGAAAIYVRTGGVGVCPAPTVAGDDCEVIPAVAGARSRFKAFGSPTVDVKLISSGTPGYSVVGTQ